MKYSQGFKEQAIKLSDEIGLKQACSQLGISYGTLSDWRKSRNRKKLTDMKEKDGTVLSGKKGTTLTARRDLLAKKLQLPPPSLMQKCGSCSSSIRNCREKSAPC